MGGRRSSDQESWLRLLRYRGLWPLLGYGYWAVREKSSGRYAGELGFADFHRDCEPSVIGVPEAGWVIARWAQGQGFAREALSAALAWLDTVPLTSQSCCLIAPDNEASIHLATSHGFARSATVFNGKDSFLFHRPRP
ncbi:MAG: GNAT family N-acetyltransferase [Steroidobacteraceae bacterium]